MSIWRIHTQNDSGNLPGVVFEEYDRYNIDGHAHMVITHSNHSDTIPHYLVCWNQYENAIHFPQAKKEDYYIAHKE